MQKADEPLRKITMNIYDSDIEWLRKEFGWGWSEIVRQWIREKINERKRNV